MKLTEEEEYCLIEELEGFFGKSPLVYLKFCRTAQFAEDVCKGNLYANTPKYFREQEKACGVRGQGDRYELLSVIETHGVVIRDAENGRTILTSPEGTATIRYKSDDVVPMVSFVGVSLADMKLHCADENHADFLLPFSDDEYASMTETFGAHCAVVDARELERAVSAYSKATNCGFLLREVEYCAQNRIDRVRSFCGGEKERFFFKNEDLAFQRECRLVLDREIPDDHFIRIGCLSNSVVIKSERLRNMCISIRYDIRRNNTVG